MQSKLPSEAKPTHARPPRVDPEILEESKSLCVALTPVSITFGKSLVLEVCEAE
jgi:hypothetical protein